MLFYLVQDASGWLSSIVSKSKDKAIISQRWRLDSPATDVSIDYPLRIMEVNTNCEYMGVIMEVSEADLKAYVEKYDSQKKGGSK